MFAAVLGLLGSATSIFAQEQPAVTPPLPESPTVVSGKVEITTRGPDMSVRQDTQFGIVNWNSFNIGAGNSVLFANGTGATLNRVTGLTASQINGNLTATGSLFLLNPNGVIIGADGRVLTGGNFVASTRDISDADFLNGGSFTLAGDSTAGVTNLGQISSLGGNVLLAGYTVENKGAIVADSGRIGLAAGQRVDVLTDVSWMNGAYAVSLGERGNNVTNEGFLKSLVSELRTHNGNIYALAGNNTGLIQATGVKNEGGKVFLTAEGGTVQSTGTIVAKRGNDGGDIEINATTVENYGGVQDVSGANGGTIRIAANSVTSDTELRARGMSGAGGVISLEGAQEVTLTSAERIDATGATRGGEIAVNATEGNLMFSGQADASGGDTGGQIVLGGNRIALFGATVDANGGAQGGKIFVGGGYQGGAIWEDGAKSPLRDFTNSQRTYISDLTSLSADANGAAGQGGTVVAWSDGTTEFAGTITARGGTASGNGGVVETSGLAGLGVSGSVDASARSGVGENGRWLLDPKNITIGTATDTLSEFQTLVQGVGGRPTDETSNFRFGNYLDLSGETAVIGSGFYSYIPHAVFVFESGQIAARLTSGSANPVLFGTGVGVEGDIVAAIDPAESYNPVGTSVNYTGMVYVFRKGAGWRNGSSNLTTRYYAADNTVSYQQGSNTGGSLWGMPDLILGENRRFAMFTDENGNVNIAVGNPLSTWGTATNGGGVSLATFNPASPPPGLQALYRSILPNFIGEPNELRMGDYLTASKGYLYIGTGDQTALQRDLFVYNANYNSGGYVRFSNYFSQSGRPAKLVADGASLFALSTSSSSPVYYGNFRIGGTGSAYGDPIAIQNQMSALYLNLGNAPFFGNVTNLAASGDTLIVSNVNPYGGANTALGFFTLPTGGRWSDYLYSSPLSPSYTYSFPTNVVSGDYNFGGYSLAIDGSYALAGLPGYSVNSSVRSRGAVAQFRRTNGAWAFTENLRPSERYEASSYGVDVAVDGNTYLVGDAYYGDQNSSTTGGGRIYVYENGTLAAALAGGIGGPGNGLGSSVAISGNRIASTSLNTLSGLVSRLYLFDKGTGWRNGLANLVSTFDDSTYMQSVALDGTTLAFGSPQAGPNNLGKVGIFTNIGSGLSNPTILRNPNAVSGTADNFGFNIALSGNTLAVNQSTAQFGSTANDAIGNYNVYLFENLANNWATATSTRLSAASILNATQDSVGFGFSLGLSGNTLAVGYQRDGQLGGASRGVYVFERNGTWANSATPVARLTAPTTARNFGFAVAVNGDTVAVSSPNYTESFTVYGADSNIGHSPVFIFKKQGGWQSGSVNAVASLLPATNINSRPFGANLALSGDTLLATSTTGNNGWSEARPVYVFKGPFDFSGRSTFASSPSGTLNISATALANSLSRGTNITLQANNDITISAAIVVNNPLGDGGDLILQAGRRLLVNAPITTDNGDLTLLAGDPRANATYRDAGEKVVVLGRDTNNAGVTLNLGTGNLLINAADRFENRTGGTSPFTFATTNPGRYLIYATTPDHTGAPDLANLAQDLATTGRSWVYYNKTFDVANLTPSWLPSGSGFIYSVQPTVQVGVGNASITYGQTATANLSLTGLTLGGNAITGSVFGISATDLPNLVTTGYGSNVTLSAGGFANAGSYTGGMTAVAKSSVTSGAVYGVAVSTGAAGNLTVAKATLNVRPDNTARVYGDANPTFTAAYTGFVTGDTLSDLDTKPTLSTTAAANSSVGTYSITGTGGLDNNYLFNFTGTGLLTVTTRDLLLTGLTGVDRAYNGTTTAGFAGTATINPLAGDNVSLAGLLTATATFADRNAANNVGISLSGITLNGAAASNYHLVLPTNLAANITPATLTLGGLTATNRTYDGTTTAAVAGTATVAPLGSDNVSLAGTASATFADKTVGTNKTVTLTGLTLTGTDANNYRLATPTLTAAITPLGLNLTGLTAVNRVYNATTSATLNGTATIAPLAGDTVTLTGSATASFADRNAGTAKPVTVGGFSLTGLDARNYSLIFPVLFANITPAPLAITGLTGVSRVYDSFTAASFSGVATVAPLGSDVVSVSGTGVASFTDKNVGTAKSLTVTGFTLSGLDALNYTAIQPLGLTANILPRVITVSDLFALDKSYDGTTTLATSGTPVFGGILAGDSAIFVVSSPTFAFADKNAGTDKAIVISGVTLTGADAANYDTTRAASLVADITPATLTVTGATAANRAYDATTTVAVSGGTLTGVSTGDTVTLNTAGATGTFASKNVGTAKAVTASGYTLTGADASNYTLAQPTGLVADVTSFSLHLLGLSGNKTYDGLASTALTYTGLDAVFAGDTVTVDASAVTAAYADKNAGTAKAITITGQIGLSGADALNYTLVQPASLTGDIARRGITVSGLTIADKVYDGTTAGVISGTGTFGGTVAGDDLSINVGAVNVTFADKNVGTNKAVSLSGVTLAGADANNYTAATPTGITASITAKDLTVTGLVALNKIYDRTATAALSGSGVLNGTISGDNLALNEAARAAAFADKNVGTDKSVAVTGLSLTGFDAANYRLIAPTLQATISPADAFVVGLTTVNRVYDATTVAGLAGTAALDFGALNNVLASAERVSLTGTAAGAFANKNVGTAKGVTVSGVALSGADATNYTLRLPTTLAANVTAADIQVTGAVAANKVYDATTAATLSTPGRVTALGTDTVQLTGTAVATFADKNVGTAKTVSVTGYTLSGADALNYNLIQPTGVTANVTKANLLLTGVVADNRIYDGTRSAPLSGTLTIAPLRTDVVTLSGTPTATFADKNVGSAKAVTLTGLSLAGTDAGNYTFVLPSLTAAVTPRALTITGLSAVNRVYDGTTTAALAGTAQLTNAIAGDNLAFNLASLVARFADKNVGAGKLVSLTGNSLTGTDAANYTQVLPSNLTATITAKLLSIIGVDATDRTYDRTTAVALTGGSLSGAVTGDTVSLVTTSATGTIADKNVGVNKAVTIAGYSLNGADAPNYSFNQPTGVDVTIAAKPLDVTGLEVADKFFDGTTSATVSGGTLGGVIAGDGVSLVTTGGAANFTDATVGLNKTVTLSGFTLSGGDASNYALPAPLKTLGNIIQNLRVITDIIPAEVLKATATAELDKQRQSLDALNAKQKNLVVITDYSAQNATVAAGITVPVVSSYLLSIPADQRDGITQSYVAAANLAQAASERAQKLADSYRDAAATYKETGQALNTVERALQTETALRNTFVARIAVADAELAKARENVATMEEARRRIDTLTRQMEEANRLGRGSEVAAYEKSIAEARGVLAGEAAARAQLNQLSNAAQDARDQLAASDAKVASLAKQKADLTTKFTETEKQVNTLRDATTSAKVAAAGAAKTLEETRVKAEANTKILLEQAERQLAAVQKETPGNVSAQVEEIMKSGDAYRHPLSPERTQVVQEAQAKIDALQARKAELATQEAAANNFLKNSSPAAGSVAREPVVEKAVRGLSSAEVAKLDLGSLGISDKDAISWTDPAIKSLNSSAAALAEKLGSVGTLLHGTLKPKMADNVSTVESRGVKELDKPTVFDPSTEVALKLEMRTYGVLPNFANKALADLPVATQLQVTNAMKATAARQEQLIQQGVDPNVAAKQAFDEKANEIVTMCLFEAVDAYGIGDIPGVQEFVGGAIGELGAQFGIRPSSIAETLMAGDIKKIAGTPEQAAKAVAKEAEKIFTNPKAAGIDVAKGTYEVLKAGGEAALAVFTGGGSDSASKAQAQQAAFEARQKEIVSLGATIARVETDRQATVAARDRNLEQAKEIIVAQKQLNEINRQTAVDIPTAEQQAKFKLDEVTANARREQIAQDIAPKAAEQQKAFDAELAKATAAKEKLSAQLNALATTAPAGGKGGP